MNQVLLLLGGMLIGVLSSAIGAPWAAAAMSIVGRLCMVALFVSIPRRGTYGEERNGYLQSQLFATFGITKKHFLACVAPAVQMVDGTSGFMSARQA